MLHINSYVPILNTFNITSNKIFLTKGRKFPYSIAPKSTKIVRAQKNILNISKENTDPPRKMDIKLQEKPVQEIVESNNNGEIPKEFVHKNGYPQAKVDTLPYMDDIVIDISLLTSSNPELANLELRKFFSAVTEWGCFQVCNNLLSLCYITYLRVSTINLSF